MSEMPAMQAIAHIRSEFPEKFGIPRQSRLVQALRAEIVLEPPYRSRDALRGLDGYSHIWLIWLFSRAVRSDWSPTVRPPRLGGNERVGVRRSARTRSGCRASGWTGLISTRPTARCCACPARI